MLRSLGCAGTVLAVLPTTGPASTATSRQGGWITPGSLSSVVASAETLQNHVYGQQANEYDSSDPVMEQARQYWLTTCTVQGQLCPQAQSGNLQCVLFVSAAFAGAGDPLPVLGNAVDFWTLYYNRAGWSRIGATASPAGSRGLPRPGDLMVWAGGQHLEKGKMVAYGHIAIVVHVVPPTPVHDGSVTVAQANAPGNRFAQKEVPGNFFTLPLHPDLSVDGWSAWTSTAGVAYGAYTVLGYLRQMAPTLLLPPGLPASNPLVQMAKGAAQTHGINAVTFLRQIRAESNFDPQAKSQAGALGIAQLLPSTASFLRVNPWQPQEALEGAARLMAQYHERYGGDDARALAAYNAGSGAMDQAQSRCGLTWFSCLPGETQRYIQTILGP